MKFGDLLLKGAALIFDQPRKLRTLANKRVEQAWLLRVEGG
jgi:hypothetical protein